MSGIDVYDALLAACIVPINHYGLEVGQFRVGDPADFIEVDSLTEFHVRRTWIDGKLVAENGKTLIPRAEPKVVNQFVATHVQPEQFAVKAIPGAKLQVIEALVAGETYVVARVENDQLVLEQLAAAPYYL